MEYKKGLILILIITNVFLASYLVYNDYNNSTGICLTGEGCKTVQNSEYSQILGVSLSWFGLMSFTALLLIYILVYKKKINSIYLVLISIIGALFALYFLYLQFFVIKAVCSTCLLLDSLSIVIAILSYITFKEEIM